MPTEDKNSQGKVIGKKGRKRYPVDGFWENWDWYEDVCEVDIVSYNNRNTMDSINRYPSSDKVGPIKNGSNKDSSTKDGSTKDGKRDKGI